jgi:HEAT repeat protein
VDRGAPATSEAEQRTIGAAAAAQGNTTLASKAWFPLVRMGDTDAIDSLVALLGESDVSQPATATEPDRAAALAEVVVAIGRAGDLERAIAVAHAIADRDVRNGALRQLAVMLVQAGQPEQAVSGPCHR